MKRLIVIVTSGFFWLYWVAATVLKCRMILRRKANRKPLFQTAQEIPPRQWLVFLPLLFLLFGCEKERIDFLYREYPLPNFYSLDLGEDGLIVINDQAHFREIFVDFPNARPVDFDKYTLLLTGGGSPPAIEKIHSAVSRDDGGKYRIKIFVLLNNGFTNRDPWYKGFVIPQTRPEDITLEVEYYRSTTTPE